jgi:protease IV
MNNSGRVFSLILITLVLLSILVGVLNILSVQKKKEPGLARGLGRFLKAEKKSTRPGIAIIHVYGPIEIGSDSQPWSGNRSGSDEIIERLESIRNNKAIKGILLRINSPGGTVGSVQEIYQKIKELRQAGKKIVVSMGDVAASGGYYIACGSDVIFANPGTLTGSIGVIMEGMDATGLLDKVGVKFNTIKSGRYKDIMSPYKNMSDDERKILQGVIDDSYSQFLKAVAESRKLSLSALSTLADGRVFTGKQARDLGLIDQLGNYESAIHTLGELTELGPSPYIYDDRDIWNLNQFLEQLSGRFNGNGISSLMRKPSTGLKYLYEP